MFENRSVIAVDKPCGQPTIPGRGEIGEPLNVEVGQRLGSKVFVVHRLDREAGGLVVFAKDAKTHRELCARFEARQVRKKYLAGVAGELSDEGVIRSPIKEFGSGRMGVGPGGKPSVTRYRALRSLPKGSLLDVEPVTGRRHQIRVHLYSIDHPVLGDRVYGRQRPVGGVERLLLHSLELDFGLEGLPSLRAEPGAGFEESFSNFLLGRP
ncbi:MAG: RNA pseudouridine synthase [Elusimicrobia bacterium]|nr:RNA pseudouridine synthase [Elusimicrobiota bacterium]